MNLKKTALCLILSLASSASFATTIDSDSLTSIAIKDAMYDYVVDSNKIIPQVNVQIRKAGGLDRLVEDAEENNDANSHFVLHNMYKYGVAFETSPEKALEHLESAVKANHPDALYAYGMYLLGYNEVDESAENIIKLIEASDPFELEPETERERYARGLETLRVAASLGNSDALYVIGMHYIHGYFMPQDDDMGLFYLSQAYADGNTRAAIAREKILGNSDYLENFNQTQRDAKYGDEDAMVTLANFYIDGFIVQQDKAKAIRLLKAAAEAGNEKAMNRLKEIL